MITVGDQIFTLTREVVHLRKQCRRYQKVLQTIIAELREDPKNAQRCAILAREALTELPPPKASKELLTATVKGHAG